MLAAARCAMWLWPRRFRRTSRWFVSLRDRGGSPTSRRSRGEPRRKRGCAPCAPRRGHRPAGGATPDSTVWWRCSCSPPGEVWCALGFEGLQRLAHVVTARQQCLAPVFKFERRRERRDLHVGLQCPFGYPDTAGGVGADLLGHGQCLVEQVIRTGHTVEQTKPLCLLR